MSVADLNGVALKQIEQDLHQRGVPKHLSNSLLIRLLWFFGLKVKPTVFHSSMNRWLLTFCEVFVIVLPLILIVSLLIGSNDSLLYRVFLAVVGSLAATVAIWFKERHRKHQIPEWSDYIAEIRNTPQTGTKRQ